MKNLFLMASLSALLAVSADSLAATYYTRSGGYFDGKIWGTTTTGPVGNFPNLHDGDVLHIDDNVIVDGNISVNAKITIYVDARVTFTGKLTLETGSTIYLVSAAGKIISNGSGNSDHIKIGNDKVWEGKDPDRTGPGAFTPAWQPGILPVKLSYFSLEQNEHAAFLSWATTVEENFREFIVERSGEGLVFEEIGTIAGQGFNIYDIESKYSFVDEAPLSGLNYYRLKAVDVDNTVEYFDVKAVRMNPTRKLAVYPNPSSGQSISFSTNFNPQESDRITLTDQVGVEVYSGTASEAEDGITFPDTLRPGIYILRYSSGDFEQTERVIVRN